MKLAPALMELQGLLAPGALSNTHCTFPSSTLIISFGFSFSFCLLSEESQVSVLKVEQVLKEVIGNKLMSQSAVWVICQGKRGSQIKTKMQARGELYSDDLSAAVDMQFPAETSVSAF